MNWLPRLVARISATVHTKLLVAFLTIVMLLISLGVVGLQVLSSANRRAEHVLRRQERIAAYQQFQRDTTLLPSWSWNERTLEARLRQLDQFRHELDQLQFAATDDAEQLASIRDSYDRSIKVIEQVVERFAAGDVAGGRALQLSQASPLADRLERLTNDLVNRAEVELVSSIEGSQAAYRTSRWVVIVFAVGSIGLALVLGYAISWSLIGPVQQMDARLRLIGSGDLSQRVQVPNRDELGALAVEFNSMAARLEESQARQEERTRELAGALQQQTATADILRVISRSPTDVRPVFDMLAQSARQLCDATYCVVESFDGTRLHFGAAHGLSPEGLAAFQQALPRPVSEDNAAGRAVLRRAITQIPDVLDDPAHGVQEVARAANYRSVVAAPMLREGHAIGAIVVARSAVGFFPDRQIELLKTFADQAVIAIENVRLFRELEARTGELTRSVGELQALSEVSQAVGSTLDLETVLATIVSRAVEISGCDQGVVYEFDEATQRFHMRAADRIGPELLETLRAAPIARGEGAIGRAGESRHIVEITDIEDERQLVAPHVRGVLLREGMRSMLAVPLVREDRQLGAIAIARREAGAFPPEVVAILQTFATQSVLAIHNARLFREIDDKSRALEELSRNQEHLSRISMALQEPMTLAEQLTHVLDAARQVVGLDRLYIFTLSAAGEALEITAQAGIDVRDWEHLVGLTIPIAEAGALAAVCRDGEPLLFTEARPLPAEYRLRSPYSEIPVLRVKHFLASPMIARGRTMGVLIAANPVSHAPIPAQTVELLDSFAAQAAVAVENARLFREIQQQKQYSETLVETSPVAIATLDLDGKVVGWNPGAERLFGYAPAEALGRAMEDLVSTPEVREEVRANVRQTLDGEWIRAIGRRARKDGMMVDVEISSMPVVVDGARVGMIGIYHDITELLRARREAEAANEAKSAFLATMSHEIRTPMNAVIGMSGLLLNTPLTDEQREYAEVIRGSGDALLTVINDILDFSKIEAGKLELELQPFDVRECVEGALDLVATRAAEKGIDLAYLVADGTPAGIVGDVTRLRQILLNLLSNAVKFTERGEVVLSVSARPLEGPLHELRFSVRDTGIGIPADRLDRLFQSFSQVDASTTRRYGGTGLGLVISQRLTELMGGQIEVTSEVGVGSEFGVTIRAAAVDVPVIARRDLSGVQPSLRSKRVLAVDDNATNRHILTAHLEAWGMHAEATESPVGALEWVAAGERFDVAILDMHMPEMDGVALAHAIRELPAGAALPLVLFTSLGRREALGDDAGFAAYLHKPIKPSQLFDALVSVLADQPVHVAPRAAARSDLDPGMAARLPLRILLAEDNVVNQKLALRLLAQMGYRADLAGNGLEALDAVERQTYDVVLMDVQMPEMDGLEASREIHRRSAGRTRPRIVAMTANAMQGDRDLCVAAGMDDYVAKPIRVEELVSALERCHLRAEGLDSTPAGSPAREAPAGVALDRAVFDRLVGSMGGAFVAELIATFDQDAGELIAALRCALAAGDLDGFRRAAHSLKSTSESLGADGLAAGARELEAAARAGRLEGAAGRVQALADRYEQVARVLGALRRDLPA